MALNRKRVLHSQALLIGSQDHSLLKTSRSDFVPGSVVRMKLRNFLTYNSVEFRAGPYLNVIMGPNGTGKSAIVCAMCLGLAGKTSLLGRASDPKDFIKYGKPEARIEIELYQNGTNATIVREIKRSSSSIWQLNGRQTTQKVVEETVCKMNVQIGNLCQFLPQEKVADFARMSQQELLENTEKSVGEGELFEKHQKLKTDRQAARKLEDDVSEMTKQLDQEKQKNARLEQDVKAFHDRKLYLEKVKVLLMKRPWLEYNHLKEDYERSKVERDQKKEELKREETSYQPLKKKHNTLNKEKEKLETDIKAASQDIRSKAREIEECYKKLNNKNDAIDEAKNEYESKLSEEEVRKKKLHDLQNQLNALETALSRLDGTDAQVVAKQLEENALHMRRVHDEITSVHTQADELRREVNNIAAEKRALENQIAQIRDVNNRRLETLKILNANTYEAVQWLRSNRQLFKKSVYEPMLISLNVSNPLNAKLVETHIPFKDLRSFIFEDPDDLDLFMKKTKEELKLKVNVACAPDQPPSAFKPRNPISRYTKFGFEHYLQDLFTCPDAVMSFLCIMHNVHNIPVGNADVKNNIAVITQQCSELHTFYTPETQYSMRRSKYTNNVATRNSALRMPRALVDSVNSKREQELVNNVKALATEFTEKEGKYKEFQKRFTVLEIQMNSFREKKRALMKQKDEKKSIQNQITTKKQRIQQVVNDAFDLEAEKRNVSRKLKAVIEQKLQYLRDMRLKNKKCLELAKCRVVKSLKLAKIVQEFTAVETELRRAKQMTENLQKELHELEKRVTDVKHKARVKLFDAKKTAGIGIKDDIQEELKKRGLWKAFSDAPTNLEELENEIHNMQARAESMFQIDEQVVREYERRQKEIEKREADLSECQSKRSSHQQDILEIRSQWLQPLNDMIARINTSFSYFFSCLNCCGEVSLKVPENQEDYEKYGICIKVKFRDDESLRELTAHHQSGGERSVSTVLYMMALQELTNCPFRVVDEINQGMDPKNERKIFELVVQTVCKRSGAQYFLLTPKLLPDLEYDDNMTVLCVYNGPYVMRHNEWDMKKFLRRRAQLQIDSDDS